MTVQALPESRERRRSGPRVGLAVSVVVPTYRRPDLLNRCLAALVAQDFPADQFEIIVADDGHEERTESAVRRWSRTSPVTVRYQPVRGAHGPAAARNAGWHAASAPIIAFTDDDCVPDRAWLRNGLAAFRPNVEAVRGRLVMPLPEVPTDYEKNSAGLASAEFVTANVFCRRSALTALGGFDTRFPKAWREDSDLHFRFLARGLPIETAPDAVVVHPVRPAGWGVSLRQQKNNLYEALLYKKHPDHYRRHVAALPPWRYYVIVASGAAAFLAGLHGHAALAAILGFVWVAFTALFVRKRLRGTSRRASHVAEMIVTSIAIPPTAVYWRLVGAWRHRVWFL